MTAKYKTNDLLFQGISGYFIMKYIIFTSFYSNFQYSCLYQYAERSRSIRRLRSVSEYVQYKCKLL